MQYQRYIALRWFRITLGIGLLENLIFALPALFAPRALEGYIEIGITNTLHWLQNIGVLLLIVTAMYIPVIKDPFRYLFVAYLAVGGRFAVGTLFLIGLLFMNYPTGMWMLSGSNLLLSSIQAVFLFFTLRAGDPRAGY